MLLAPFLLDPILVGFFCLAQNDQFNEKIGLVRFAHLTHSWNDLPFKNPGYAPGGLQPPEPPFATPLDLLY